MSKRPAFQFYPADWRADMALQACSVTARGVWHEMICLMHAADPYGHLVVGARAMTEPEIARAIGATLREVHRSLAELEAAGVFSRTEAGVVFSRRMVRDEKLRSVRAAGGVMGGNPQLLDSCKVNLTTNLAHNLEPNQDGEHKVNLRPNLTPTPSSSSSSSSSKQQTQAREARPVEAAQPKRKQRLQFALPDWVPADAWCAWAEARERMRKPLTDRAKSLAIKVLASLRDDGEDPREVLELAAYRGWTGLFSTRRPRGSSAGQRDVGRAQPSPEIDERQRAYRLMYSREGRNAARGAFPDLAAKDDANQAQIVAQILAEKEHATVAAAAGAGK